MKVIILAGGFGTRLSEYTDVIPKPMVPIGGKPILWHIMNSYAQYGHKDFYVALIGGVELFIKTQLTKAPNGDFMVPTTINPATRHVAECQLIPY